MSAEKPTESAVGPFTCMYCAQGTDSDDDICDECREYLTPTRPSQENATAAVPQEPGRPT